MNKRDKSKLNKVLQNRNRAFAYSVTQQRKVLKRAIVNPILIKTLWDERILRIFQDSQKLKTSYPSEILVWNSFLLFLGQFSCDSCS